MAILLIIVLLLCLIASPESFIFIFVAIIAVGIFYYYLESQKIKLQQEKEAKKKKQEQIALEELMAKYNTPNDCKTINYVSGHPLVEKKHFNMYIWIENEILHFLDVNISNNIGKIEIPLKDIEYYEVRGEVHRETKISGGGISGGGSSIGGAIAGGLIAGEVGAIIGSRQKIKNQPIVSKTITHDKRETFLNFFIDGKKYSMFFNYEGYNVLLDLIPDKAYTNIYNNYIMNQVNKDEKEKTLNQIKKLSELRDEGILTEDEFQEKKKELLSKI